MSHQKHVKPNRLGWPVLVASALMCVYIGSSASAAVIQGVPGITTPAGSVNLTTAGTTDWAFWSFSNGTLVSGAPSDRKNNVATPLIGSVSTTGSGSTGPRGYNGSTTPFGWSDGTTTSSKSAATTYAIGDTIKDTAGAGISFTVQGDPSKLTTVYVYVTGSYGTGTLSASLNDASDYTNPNSTTWTSTSYCAMYTLSFTPDSASDLLTVRFVMTTDDGNASNNSRVALQAVAVTQSPVPEAASLGFLIVGGVSLLARRNARRR